MNGAGMPYAVNIMHTDYNGIMARIQQVRKV